MTGLRSMCNVYYISSSPNIGGVAWVLMEAYRDIATALSVPIKRVGSPQRPTYRETHKNHDPHRS